MKKSEKIILIITSVITLLAAALLFLPLKNKSKERHYITIDRIRK